MNYVLFDVYVLMLLYLKTIVCDWSVQAMHGNVGFLFNYMQIDWNQSAKPKFLITLDDQEIQWWVFWNKEKIKV